MKPFVLLLSLCGLAQSLTADTIYAAPADTIQSSCLLGMCDFGLLVPTEALDYTAIIPASALSNLPQIQTLPAFELPSDMGGQGAWDFTKGTQLGLNGLGFDAMQSPPPPAPPLIAFGVFVFYSEAGDTLGVLLDNTFPGVGDVPFALYAGLDWQEVADPTLQELLDQYEGVAPGDSGNAGGGGPTGFGVQLVPEPNYAPLLAFLSLGIVGCSIYSARFK